MNTKQVIVVRKFPSLRTGKYCAQVAHSSIAFLTKHSGIEESLGDVGPMFYTYFSNNNDFHEEVNHWLKNSFKKIVAYVNSEEELDTLYAKATSLKLEAHLITDNGATEFNGVPTKTALAIGPHWDYKFEGITDNLPLL